MQKSHFGLGRDHAAWHLPSKSSFDFCVWLVFPQVFQVCLLFNGLGDDCAAISSTAKAVVSLVEAVLQEFPNGCGRAKNADRIEDRFRTAICFTLWLNLQMEPFANWSWSCFISVLDTRHSMTHHIWYSRSLLPSHFIFIGLQPTATLYLSVRTSCSIFEDTRRVLKCQNWFLRFCCRHFTESPFDGEEPMTPESPTSSKPLLPEVWSLKSWSCWSWSYLKNCGRFLFIPYLLGERSTEQHNKHL